MIAMQYKISLPDNYDMNVIRQRVADNGHRTDGFQDLIFKAYLISEKRDSSKSCNEYSPLYVWQNNDGMNKFIFEFIRLAKNKYRYSNNMLFGKRL